LTESIICKDAIITFEISHYNFLHQCAKGKTNPHKENNKTAQNEMLLKIKIKLLIYPQLSIIISLY